ncbi:Hypothetical protein D9617_34g041070 [Elsinoe fawcettii]|nr:Hypothetical protein D9617_34g041070 [Elsinoe fawcettii]
MPIVGAVDAVERKDGKLFFHTSYHKGRKTVRPTGLTYALPEPLWSSLSSLDQQSILAFRACEEVIVLAIPLLKEMLKGVLKSPSSIWIMPAELQNYPFTTHDVLDGVPDYISEGGICINHMVIKVTLKSDESYIIDLAGAQYGLFDHVVPFKQYLEKYCKHVSMLSYAVTLRPALETTKDHTGRVSDMMKRHKMINLYLDIGYAAMRLKLQEWLDAISNMHHDLATTTLERVDRFSRPASRNCIINEEARVMFDKFHEVDEMAVLKASMGLMPMHLDRDGDGMDEYFKKLKI